MTPRQQLKKAVIMAIHLDCKTYEEALEKELEIGYNCKIIDCIGEEYTIAIPLKENSFFVRESSVTIHRSEIKQILGLPNPLSRILQALENKYPITFASFGNEIIEIQDHKNGKNPIGYQTVNYICDWKRTKDNGETATDDDQTDETIEKLLTLLI